MKNVYNIFFIYTSKTLRAVIFLEASSDSTHTKKNFFMAIQM